MIKSPLRYPGGKSRAVKILFDIVPTNTKEICSPFFGGGSFEIYCAQKDIRVYGYDNFQPLVDFWQCLLNDPDKLVKEVKKETMPVTRERFYEMQKEHIESKSNLERAALFFILNRTSYSGSTLSGGMASGPPHGNPRFTPSSIDRLKKFKIKNLTVEMADFRESINKHKDILLYLDPPYMIESKLYGVKGDLHKGFDHEELARLLRKREKWILSYNADSEKICELYDGFQIIRRAWTYGMSKDKKSREIIILSNDVKVPDV